MERATQLDNDWQVIGAEGRKGVPLRIQGYKVGGGTIGNAVRKIEVKEKEVRVCEEFCN